MTGFISFMIINDLIFIDWVFQTGCIAPGSTALFFNDWGTSGPRILPPIAVKSKPPALRVVVDSAKRIGLHHFLPESDEKKEIILIVL